MLKLLNEDYVDYCHCVPERLQTWAWIQVPGLVK